MYQIRKKTVLNNAVTMMEIDAPLIARKAEPGQFVILRPFSDSERIPLTIYDYNRQRKTISIIFQIVGTTTWKLNTLQEGDSISDIAGPLGKPSELENLKKVAIVGGGVGCAIAFPIAKKLHSLGAETHSIIGFRSADLVILEEEFKTVSDIFSLNTDDGSAGNKGLVTDALKRLIEAGNHYDRIIVIGPLIMMKFVCKLTKEYGVKTVVSMNPIMIDGTGMCGCCRLTVNKKMVFACVDGPEFDGHQVDFDEALNRLTIYKEFEHHNYEKNCNLFLKEGK